MEVEVDCGDENDSALNLNIVQIRKFKLINALVTANVPISNLPT